MNDPAFAAPFFATVDDHRTVVVLEDGAARDLCEVLHGAVDESPDHARACLPAAIAAWPEIEKVARAVVGRPWESVVVRAPIPRPINVLGAPVNFRAHQGELGAERSSKGTVQDMGLFVKASGSVSGPDSSVTLPDLPGREFHYEGEIAIVIGAGGLDLDREAARAAIAGFTGALDVTMRLETDHREERSMRKSFASFTPTGPAVLPAAPGMEETLGLRLSVNGELRQEGTLAQLIVGAVDLVMLASSVIELEAGDLILLGTPQGVGPLSPGDKVRLDVDGLPPLELDVARRRGPS
ncbi:MAG: fumarylacetoacetate hydrolase family protein [Microcella sp.]|uniref:fumarylacetoacetate hydrolase family protein n=1 Tax=Microcella sp. TaxID=1913979 RepID=UPI003314865B